MSNSLRDQLLGLGFRTSKPEAAKARTEGRRDGRPAGGKGQGKGPQGKGPSQGRGQAPGKAGAAGRANAAPRARSQEEIDLAKAYAIRAQKEKEERLEAERQRQEAARLRREAKAKLAAFVQGKTLNLAEADIARHFPYGGKIKRIHVTAEQLKALNAGELGVLQMDGRYLLVDAATLAEAEAIFPAAVALKVDPSAPAEDDPYADPKYQVPDDLVW